MENALWNFLFIALVIIILQYSRSNISAAKKIIACALSILITLARPEAYAWNIFFFVLFALLALKNKRSILFSLAYLAVFIFTAAALLIFRLKYFGYPLPNTYYAKVSPDKLYNIKEGLIYAINFITDFHPVVILFIVVLFVTAAAMLINNRKIILHINQQQENIIIIALIILIALFLPLATGGDHFSGFRFYQEIILLSVWAMPAIFILYRDAVLNKIKYATTSLQLVVVIFFLLIGGGMLFNLKHPLQTQLDYEFTIANEQRAMANEMNNFWADTSHLPTAGVIFAGSFALKYKGFTIDLMGLNNTLMGHSSGNRIGIKNHAAFNKDVFYILKPDILFPENVASEKIAQIKYIQLLSNDDFLNRAMKNIFNDSVFQQTYYPAVITNKTLGKKVFLFSNKYFLQKLQNDKSLQLKRL